jgi:hypothetical protein
MRPSNLIRRRLRAGTLPEIAEVYPHLFRKAWHSPVFPDRPSPSESLTGFREDCAERRVGLHAKGTPNRPASRRISNDQRGGLSPR